MSDKSPRKSMSKKCGKSLKEKRADKKAKASEHTVMEGAFSCQETLTLQLLGSRPSFSF